MEEEGREEEDSRLPAPLPPPQCQVATKRQKVIFEFAHLSQFLEERQSVLLAQLEKLDGDILKQREEFDVLVGEEICRFSSLISELEEKHARPARALLTVRPAPPACPPLTSCAFACPSLLPFPPVSLHPVPAPWPLTVRPTVHHTGGPSLT